MIPDLSLYDFELIQSDTAESVAEMPQMASTSVIFWTQIR